MGYKKIRNHQDWRKKWKTMKRILEFERELDECDDGGGWLTIKAQLLRTNCNKTLFEILSAKGKIATLTVTKWGDKMWNQIKSFSFFWILLAACGTIGHSTDHLSLFVFSRDQTPFHVLPLFPQLLTIFIIYLLLFRIDLIKKLMFWRVISPFQMDK